MLKNSFQTKSNHQNVLVTLPTDNLGHICTRLLISKINQIPQVRLSDRKVLLPCRILAFQKTMLTIVSMYTIILKSNAIRFCQFFCHWNLDNSTPAGQIETVIRGLIRGPELSEATPSLPFLAQIESMFEFLNI